MRMGGDEFAVLVCATRWSSRLEGLCDQVIALASEPFKVVGIHPFVRTAVGAVAIGEHDASAGKIVRKADTALYESKHHGKGCYFIYTPAFDASLSLRRTIEVELTRSLEEGVGLSYAYQPLICTADGRVTSVEALARWDIQSLAVCLLCSPVAEETGLISRLGEWVLRRACQEARSWSIDLLAGIVPGLWNAYQPTAARAAASLTGRFYASAGARPDAAKATRLRACHGNVRWVVQSLRHRRFNLAAMRNTRLAS